MTLVAITRRRALVYHFSPRSDNHRFGSASCWRCWHIEFYLPRRRRLESPDQHAATIAPQGRATYLLDYRYAKSN